MLDICIDSVKYIYKKVCKSIVINSNTFQRQYEIVNKCKIIMLNEMQLLIYYYVVK